MPTESRKVKDELCTWQEVASYLGVSVRTAQTWHADRGLPVRKIGGRVSAVVSELDAWKGGQPAMPTGRLEAAVGRREANSPAGEFRDGPAIESDGIRTEDGAVVTSGRKWHQRRWIWVGAVGLLVGCVAIGLVILTRVFLHPRQPVSFRVDAHVLRTFDANGKQVWEFTLHGVAAGAYSDEENSFHGHNGLFADLYGDGNLEFLFIYKPQAETDGDALYCFNSRGGVAWTRRVGHDVTTQAGTLILDNYLIHKVGVLKHARQDGGRIVVGSHHVFSWTSQITILTANGKQVAEYWHPGWIFSMALADLDGDGVDEIILGALNEGYRSQGYGATLVVLDSREVTGQGQVPEGDHQHQIKDVPAGQEAAILLFPEFKVKPNEIEPFCFVDRIYSIREHLEFIVGQGQGLPSVHYQLDRHLQIASITPADLYKNDFFFPGIGRTQRHEPIGTTLARVRVLRNRFVESSK